MLGDDRRLSYAEAEARSAALARGLLAAGAGKGTRVGLLAGNGPDWIVGWLGITRMGGVAVLLNTYSKATELGWLLRHGDVQALLTVDAPPGPRLPGPPGAGRARPGRGRARAHPPARRTRTCGRCGPGATAAGGGPRPSRTSWRGARACIADLLAACEAEVTPADPMVVVYSSGSTADPKGAVHSHGAVVRHAHNLWPMRDLVGDDVLYTPMPLFWVGGLSFTLIAAMHAGATLVFEDQFEPGATLGADRAGAGHPGAGLAPHGQGARRPPELPRAGPVLRPGRHAGRAAPRTPSRAAPPPKATSLGMTETLGPHTFDAYDDPLPPEKEGSFGLSVPGVEHKLVDPVTGEDVPVGATGELWVRGYSLMLGLHKRERADTFTPDGWYRTGDGGHFDEDGHFYFTGRMGELIKSSGMNITPAGRRAGAGGPARGGPGLRDRHRPSPTGARTWWRPSPCGRATRWTRTRPASGSRRRSPPTRCRGTSRCSRTRPSCPWLDSGKVDRRRLAAILDERFREA